MSMAFPEPTPRRGCVSATINSRVYVWGGETASRNDTSHLANLNILDSCAEKWLSRPITGQHPPGYKYCAAAQEPTSYTSMEDRMSITNILDPYIVWIWTSFHGQSYHPTSRVDQRRRRDVEWSYRKTR